MMLIASEFAIVVLIELLVLVVLVVLAASIGKVVVAITKGIILETALDVRIVSDVRCIG